MVLEDYLGRLIMERKLRLIWGASAISKGLKSCYHMGAYYTIKFNTFGEIKNRPLRAVFIEICQVSEMSIPKEKEKWKE